MYLSRAELFLTITDNVLLKTRAFWKALLSIHMTRVMFCGITDVEIKCVLIILNDNVLFMEHE